MSKLSKRKTKYAPVQTSDTPKQFSPTRQKLHKTNNQYDNLKYILNNVLAPESIHLFVELNDTYSCIDDPYWSYDVDKDKGHPFISSVLNGSWTRLTDFRNNLNIAKDMNLKNVISKDTREMWITSLGSVLVVAFIKDNEKSSFQEDFFSNLSTFIKIDNKIQNQSKFSYLENLASLIVQAISKKDAYTGGHTKRVGMFAEMICDELDCDESFKKEVVISAIIHDIGKIGIPDKILKKTSPLTEEEYEVMKRHPEIGGEILKKVPGFENILLGVSCHHERPDGKGYPKGLKAEQIPLIARIISLSDAFDAMVSTRPYRKGISPMEAFEILKDARGTQFDITVFDAFERAFLKSNISKRYRESLKKVG